MDFIAIKVKCSQDISDILIAELSDIGFDSFIEGNDGFEAYVQEPDFNENELISVNDKYSFAGGFTYQLQKVQKVNWNEEWEKNYEPIIIEDKCIVKASFHNVARKFPYEIIINPKMSFGTGHHATTYLMLSYQLELDFSDKIVLDAGCGTGILGIFASKAGAGKVDGCDIDDWCIENGKENIELNSCDNFNIYLGTVKELPSQYSYDVLLANINKNVLLEEIRSYAALQEANGILLLSGFYEQDIADIERECLRCGYRKMKYATKDNWACTQFLKL